MSSWLVALVSGWKKRFTTKEPLAAAVSTGAGSGSSPSSSSPRTIIFSVRPMMRRSSKGPALRTYQASSATFSSALRCWPPLTWAQPVMPGRIAMRSLTRSGRSRATAAAGR